VNSRADVETSALAASRAIILDLDHGMPVCLAEGAQAEVKIPRDGAPPFHEHAVIVGGMGEP